MSKQLPNDAYWAVEGRLMAGPYAGAEFEDEAVRKIRDLVRAGITHFLDLTEEGELNHFGVALSPYESILDRIKHFSRRPISYRRVEIRDVSVPSKAGMRRILDHISTRVDNGDIVYVHCWGGVGRTGTVVGCHLIENGLNPEDVIGHITELRRDLVKSFKPSPETYEQVEFVQAWSVDENQ